MMKMEESNFISSKTLCGSLYSSEELKIDFFFKKTKEPSYHHQEKVTITCSGDRKLKEKKETTYNLKQ